MESQKVVVVVEETEAARTALKWAIHNFIRSGDSITLLHVHPCTRSTKRQKTLRLQGFHLALSFKDLCNGIAEAKVEILVKEGDIATAVVALVNKIGASTLVVGLHHKSFLYKRSSSSLGTQSLKCRVLAVRQHSTARDCFVSAELSQVQVTTFCMSEPKTIFPCPMWKRSRRRRVARQA